MTSDSILLPSVTSTVLYISWRKLLQPRRPCSATRVVTSLFFGRHQTIFPGSLPIKDVSKCLNAFEAEESDVNTEIATCSDSIRTKSHFRRATPIWRSSWRSVVLCASKSVWFLNFFHFLTKFFTSLYTTRSKHVFIAGGFAAMWKSCQLWKTDSTPSSHAHAEQLDLTWQEIDLLNFE